MYLISINCSEYSIRSRIYCRSLYRTESQEDCDFRTTTKVSIVNPEIVGGVVLLIQLHAHEGSFQCEFVDTWEVFLPEDHC